MNGNVYVCWDCLVEWNGARSKKRTIKKHGDSPLAGLGLCA